MDFENLLFERLSKDTLVKVLNGEVLVAIREKYCNNDFSV